MTISRLVFAAVVAAGIAAAQTEYITAKMDGISGSSTLVGHTGECEALAWAFGATDQPPSSLSTSGAAAPKVQVSALVLTRRLDACSPRLFNYATIGQHMNTVTLTQSELGGTLRPVMVVTLSEVTVSNYQIGGTAGDKASPPAESVSLAFAKITFEYFVYRPDGSQGSTITVSYDVTKGY